MRTAKRIEPTSDNAEKTKLEKANREFFNCLQVLKCAVKALESVEEGSPMDDDDHELASVAVCVVA
jgi:hypothetical protein